VKKIALNVLTSGLVKSSLGREKKEEVLEGVDEGLVFIVLPIRRSKAVSQVVPKDLHERDTCLCEKCENFRLLIEPLKRVKAIEVNSPAALIRAMCCEDKNFDCYQRSCSECETKGIPFVPCGDEEKTVKVSKWVRVTEEKQSNQGKTFNVTRTVKKNMEESIRNIKAELAKSCDGFLLHTFRESHQTKVLKVKRENLDNDELCCL